MEDITIGKIASTNSLDLNQLGLSAAVLHTFENPVGLLQVFQCLYTLAVFFYRKLLYNEVNRQGDKSNY